MNETVYKIFKKIKCNQKCNNVGPFNFKPDYVSHKMAFLYKCAGIVDSNTHSLRKTFGSILLQNG